MEDYLFLFDLDSTITKEEVVPVISSFLGEEAAQEMRRITEDTMMGKIPFRQSLIERVSLLSHVDVELVNRHIREMSLNEKLLDFIQRHKDRCYVVTGNLDVWIRDLVKRMELEGHVFCSRTQVENGQIRRLVSVIDKGAVADSVVGKFVAVGDGSNDAPMCAKADIGIGFGGVRPVAPPLAAVADRIFDTEEELVAYLETLI